MKSKIIIGILVIEAVVCILLYLARVSFAGVFSSAMAFPFEQIGLGLRALSLSGGVGNALAVSFYFAICLLPAGILIFFSRKRKFDIEDWLIGLLCVMLFVVLYLMINPGLILSLMGMSTTGLAEKAIMGITVYSLLCCYLVIRILRSFTAGNIQKLEGYMIAMLNFFNFIFVYLAFGAYFGDLLDSISSLRAGNAGNEHLLGTSYAFLFLQFIVNALPYVLNVFVIFAALRLVSEMQIDRYSAETVAAVLRMSRLCTAVLAVTVLSNAGFNLLQLFFAKSLRVINSTVQIPVLSILFVLASLLLTRFVAENKQLKDENNQFI